MRQIRLLLLALFFVLSTSASAAASVHKCCPSQDCDIAHCLDMGCASAMPAAAFNKAGVTLAPLTVREYAAAVTPRPPFLYKDVWKPPD